MRTASPASGSTPRLSRTDPPSSIPDTGLRRWSRIAGRSAWLAAEIFLMLARFAWLWVASGGRPSLAARARWLQHGSRRTLRIFRTRLTVSGHPSCTGLLVSNHLSYLDIPVLATCVPAVFVAKSDVRHWPIFGTLASLGGTLFVRRDRRTAVRSTSAAIRRVMDLGVPLVLFPEGTSSDGHQVLPFKSSLLEPAAQCDHPVTVAHLRYALEDGDAGQEVAYWGEMTFLPHLVNLLGKRRVSARVRFEPAGGLPNDRKALARELHVRIQQLADANTDAL